MRVSVGHCYLSSCGYFLVSPSYAPLSRLEINCYTPSALQHSLAPHSSTLLLFTTSGQTHIFPEIRIDAVRLLDLYLETFPDLVICGWSDGKNGHGRRVLDGYLSILNISTKLSEEGGKFSFTARLLRY